MSGLHDVKQLARDCRGGRGLKGVQHGKATMDQINMEMARQRWGQGKLPERRSDQARERERWRVHAASRDTL